MPAKHMLRVGGVVAAVFGVLLLIKTGPVALALGAIPSSVDGATAERGVAFWFQLAFIRLFAVSILGLSSVLMWSATHLAPSQQRGLARLGGGVFAVLAAMAATQQVAIWSGVAGWGVATVLALIAAVCFLGGTWRAAHAA